MKKITDSTILDCGHVPSKHGDHTTGYGTDRHGKTFCYECCAENDKQDMIMSGRATLYLTDGFVTNWPGSLKIPVWNIVKGKHNIARTRYDAWFKFNGKVWHGVQYGDNTQIIHCKETKQTSY